MRLTKSIREAFVRAVMCDVPSVDYKEQIRKLILEDAVAQLPPAVRALWDDPKVSRNFIHVESYHPTGLGLDWFTVTIPTGRTRHVVTPAVWDAIEDMALKHKQQAQDRKDLESRLMAVAYSCSTRKALATALPEFEKYLPAEDPAVNRNVPALAGVVADFVRAGWPKDRKPPEAPKQATAGSAVH